MSEGSLSQEEIDALLQSSGSEVSFESIDNIVQNVSAGHESLAVLLKSVIPKQQQTLSMLVSKPATLHSPTVSSTTRESVSATLDKTVVEIDMSFSSGVSGRHSYILSPATALAIAGPIMGQENLELNEAVIHALQEGFAQLAEPVIEAIGLKAGQMIMTDTTVARSVSREKIAFPQGEFVTAAYTAHIQDGPALIFIELFEESIAQAVIDVPVAQPAQVEQRLGPAEGRPAPPSSQPSMGNIGVQPVQFASLSPTPSGDQGNIGLLMDVFMEMTVELGRTRKLVKDILGMGEGTIIELDKLAGEPVDILVNRKLIAKGEVVVIDENFGVRVTEIVSPMERMGDVS